MNIGWIGVGIMGSRMSKRLLDAGYQVFLCDKAASNLTPLLELGAGFADSPQALALKSDIIFTMIPNAAVLKSITSGNNGILQSLRKGTIVVDMSTIDPESSAEVNEEILKAGGKFLRATVTGSTEFAETGALGIMVSGEKKVFETVLPLLKVLGNRQHYLGEKEESRYMKICINMMIGTSMQMMAESMILGEKAGLDWETMVTCLCDSAAASSIMKAKESYLKAKNFNPMCTCVTIEKDMDIALSLGKEHALSLPVTAITRQLYASMRSHNMGEMDYSGILLLNEIIAGLK